MSNSERMAPVDTTWLRMERPTNLMVIVGVLLLAGRVDVRRLEMTLARRILAIPRFRQRTEPRQGGFWWTDDTHFDISRHIKRIRLPGAGDKAELQRFVAELASTPLDPEHPRWQFHIVEDYDGGAALIARIHHAIGDGIAMLGVLPGGEARRVLRIGLQRVNGRIESRLRTLAIQSPEGTHITLGMAGHRLGEVASGWLTAPMMVSDPSLPPSVFTVAARS
jgi:Wax ester synthase-like Acyl-CoA acyltransferase domain